MQVQLPGTRPDPPEHMAAIVRHRRRSWWRADCSCRWHGPWREREDQAWDDADAHERSRAA